MDLQEHIKSLDDKRKRAAEEQRKYIDDAIARHPGEPFTEEERQYIERTDADIDSANADIQAYLKRNERETADAVLRESHAAVFGDGQLERAEQSESRRIASWARGETRTPWSEDGKSNVFLFDLKPAARRANLISTFGIRAEDAEGRALLWDTGSVASGVPTTTSDQLYQLMTAGIAAFRMPTTKITTDGGETMYFPKLAAHGIGTQVIAQGTAIGGTDPTFARMQLDAFKYGQLVQVASETISDTGFDVTSFVVGNIARAVAQVVDADLVAGTGSNEPLGMAKVVWTGGNAAGSVPTGGSLITPTYENLVDMVYSINDQYRQSPGVAWLMRDATAGIIRKVRDGAGGTVGQPIWQMAPWQGLVTGEPDRLLNYPIYTDPNVASCASNAKVAFFADWNAYYTRIIGNLAIERSDDYAFNTDLVTFRGKQRFDGDAIDVTAGSFLIQNV